MKYLKRKESSRPPTDNEERKRDEMGDQQLISDYQELIHVIFEGLYMTICD